MNTRSNTDDCPITLRAGYSKQEPSIEELTDPNGKFDTIPAGPPDMGITIAYEDLSTLEYAIKITLHALYKVQKSISAALMKKEPLSR